MMSMKRLKSHCYQAIFVIFIILAFADSDRQIVEGQETIPPHTLYLPRLFGRYEFRCENAQGIPLSECEALTAIYDLTNGSNWRNHSNWLSDDYPCRNWWGVSCSEGHVNSLTLSNNSLSGSLPKEIGELSSLSALYLQGNSLQVLPPEIGNLGNLRELYLSYSGVHELPATMAALDNLEVLGLEGLNLVEFPPFLGSPARAQSALPTGRNRLGVTGVC